jgi:hypothetical protein
MTAGGPTAEDLVAELRKAKVAELLVHTCSLLASLAYGKLAPEARDLEDAKLAIDALKALAPLLPEEPRKDIQSPISSSLLPKPCEYAVGMAKKKRNKRMKTKTAQPSGRPETLATHGREHFAPPRQAQVKSAIRLPGKGMR